MSSSLALLYIIAEDLGGIRLDFIDATLPGTHFNSAGLHRIPCYLLDLAHKTQRKDESMLVDSVRLQVHDRIVIVPEQTIVRLEASL